MAAYSNEWYVFKDGVVRHPVDDAEMSEFYGSKARFLIKTKIMDSEVYVSTVFLCLDHRYTSTGPPVIF